jgi:hypothetical protein
VSEGGDGQRKIKVVDRRRFDEEGELRPDRPAPEPKPAESRREPEQSPATPPPRNEVATDSGSAKPGSGSGSSPVFMELIAALAQQAEILISGAQGLPAQPEEAQRVIDYLSVLETKTRGNLTAEEAQVLSNVVFQLRALYVQRTK